jgi:hypothetical protein
VAPGDYLQVSVIANVILPAGDFTASPATTAASVASASSGAQAVTALLEGGVL